MENNLENKARFFALYWGQKCAFMRRPHEPEYLEKVSDYSIAWVSYLELKPLSSISDFHSIEVAKIICPEMFLNADSDPIRIERNTDWLTVWRRRNIYSVDIDYLGYTTCQNEDTEYKRNSIGTTQAIDYLRSKGYALPWMGLSIEKQIEYGWIKLKQK